MDVSGDSLTASSSLFKRSLQMVDFVLRFVHISSTFLNLFKFNLSVFLWRQSTTDLCPHYVVVCISINTPTTSKIQDITPMPSIYCSIWFWQCYPGLFVNVLVWKQLQILLTSCYMMLFLGFLTHYHSICLGDCIGLLSVWASPYTRSMSMVSTCLCTFENTYQ